MASPNIAFDTILASMRKPGQYLEWNNKLAVQNLPTNRQRVLLIGQRLSSATDTGKLFDIRSDTDVAASCGYGSIAHLMARAAITAYPYAALSMITVADNSEGHAATGKITLSGTATKSGRISVRINNFDTINVLIANADTASVVATALQNAINAEISLPVTAAIGTDEITLTAKNKGLAGNDIKVSTTVTATGMTSTVTAMAYGDLNPSIKAVLAAVAGEGHNIIVCPFNDEQSCLDLRAHLETVADPREKRWAVGVIGHTGTLAQSVTLTTSLNSEFESLAWYKGCPSLSYELAAAYAAVIASEEDPARPLNGLKLRGIGVCAPEDKTLRTEQENALYNGVTPIETGVDGTSCRIVRAITTYTKSANGTEDPSYLDLTTIRTLIYVSKACIDRIALRFPRDKLSNKTPARVRSELLDVLIKCEELEILENVEANKDKLIVERDSQNVNQINARIPTDVVNGLHIFAGILDLYL